jgi:hypothetical protein
MFNNIVAHVASSWARVTRAYANHDLLHQFMHVGHMQVKKMLDRFDRELASFGTEDVIRRICNKTDQDKTRLPL